MRENYTSEEEEELQNLVENGIVTTKDILESSPLLRRTRTNAQITNKLKNMKKKRKREAHKHFAKSVARMRREWLIVSKIGCRSCYVNEPYVAAM